MGGVFVNKFRKFFRLVPPVSGAESDIVSIHSHSLPIHYRRHAPRPQLRPCMPTAPSSSPCPAPATAPLPASLSRAAKAGSNASGKSSRPRKPPPPVLRPGMEILFRGGRETIALLATAAAPELLLADQRIPFDPAAEDIRPAVERHLQKLAGTELTRRVEELAARHECQVKRVVIRNQRTRWGSCSCHGSISLNWRLIQLPPHVRDYIIIHELMHLRHLNHSPRFWPRSKNPAPNTASPKSGSNATPPRSASDATID